jgi:hypothetical protein
LNHRNISLNRRDFLAQSSTLAAASLLRSTLFSQTPAPEHAAPHIPSRDTTLKFNPDGTRRPFAGNTIICHLPVQCAQRDEMIVLHEALAKSSFRHKLGLTSTDSYHMTVFPGANDPDRATYGWPSYVPIDASIETCNRMVEEHMAKARFTCQLPIRMRVDQDNTVNFVTACSLRLVPVDPQEEAKLRTLRDQIAVAYGFRLKDHATYQFHMTMSYQMAPFTPEEQAAYRSLLRPHIQRIIAAQPILELGVPEYCTFPDMFRFEPKKLLVCS